MTKIIPPPRQKKRKDVGGRKTVEISRHFKLFLAFVSTFMLKTKVGGEASSLSR